MVTLRAAAIFKALDTKQSPRFSISCNVLLEIPVISTSFGIDIAFDSLISLILTQSLLSKDSSQGND